MLVDAIDYDFYFVAADFHSLSCSLEHLCVTSLLTGIRQQLNVSATGFEPWNTWL